MILRKPNINYIDQKIFLYNLNSWFSNFIIEEFRTDYLPDSKIQTIITGTMDPSGGPLPQLFEPSFTSIELGYDYSQDVFDNDIFIFNLDDSYLPEVEFVIRGLQNIEIEKEKILIIVSNIMTWAETPLKIYTEEETKKEGFNEEEVPEIEDNIKFEEEKNEQENKNINENSEQNKENQDNIDNTKDNKDNIQQTIKENNEEINHENNTLQKENEKILNLEEGKKEEDKQFGESVEEEEYENESQMKKDDKDEMKIPEEPKKKIFYYNETEYSKRLPNLKYLYYKILENKALNNKNPKLKTYIICPGFIYGCGEDFFFNYFKMSWMQQMPYIPLVGEGKNYIPTIHILDLVKIIRKIIEKKPQQNYFFVRDKTKIPTLKNILNSIGMGIGGMPVKKLNRFSIENAEIPDYTELKIDLRMKLSNIFEEQKKSKENIMDFKDRQFKWHCEFGIPENIDKLREEFNLYRNLKPIKIIVTGPPCGGKTTLCEFLTKKYNLNNYKINQFCDWAKNPDSPLAEETQQKLQEIEENITKALDDYEHRKNKRKTDPPLDTSQLKKFPSDFMGKILKERLSSGECGTKGYILDNYPKTYEDCVNMFCTTAYDKEKKDKYTLIDKIIPGSVIIINNYTEENLRNKLKQTENYEQNQGEIDSRFNRRLILYKQQNEVMEENKKFAKDFFKEYNIEIYFLDEQKYMLNKDEEEKKVIEFLERNGPIDNYSNLHDVDDIIPYIDTPLGDNINMPNEEQILFEQNGPYNFGMKKKVDVIKEENENNNINVNNNINNNINNENNQNDVNNQQKQENKEKPENINESKIKNEKSQLGDTSKNVLSKKEDNNEKIKNTISETNKEEISSRSKEEEKEQNEKKEEEKTNNEIKKEEKEVLSEEKKTEMQIKDLQEREKKLLEKKSEVLRRYLNENVMPLLARGILNVCEYMPDDPVDALANFLLENSFNMQKGKIGDIEKIIDAE